MIPLYIPSPSISEFHLGPVTIRFYALCLLTGIIAAWWLGSRRWVKRGGTRDAWDTIALWAVVFGIVGARIYHVLTHWGDYFGPGHLNPFAIWEGGIAIFGAVIGGALGAYLAARRTRTRFLGFADAVAPGLSIGQALGRFGNWFNQELFGGPLDAPWALEIDPQHRPAGYEDYATFHPTFLYESVWNLGVAGILLWADRRWKLGHGAVFALWGVGYGLGRFWIEGMRTDFSYFLGPLRTNQVTALLIALAAAVVFVWLRRRYPVREASVELGPKGERGAENEAEADAEVGAETDADAEDSGRP